MKIFEKNQNVWIALELGKIKQKETTRKPQKGERFDRIKMKSFLEQKDTIIKIINI